MSEPDKNAREIAFLNGLVSFYSKKAATHASFVVTGIFGIYAILFNKNNLPWWAFYFSYAAALIIGLYSFENFSLYSSLADYAKQELGVICECGNVEDKLYGKINKRSLLAAFYELRNKLLRGVKQHIILLALWLLAVLLPLIGMLATGK